MIAMARGVKITHVRVKRARSRSARFLLGTALRLTSPWSVVKWSDHNNNP
jgi:hypothetical protein